MQDGIKPDTFLHKRSYQRRRLRDGLKFLPLIGAWLFLMPVLWPNSDASNEPARQTSQALIYVFGAWFFVILLSAGFLHFYNRFRASSDRPNDPGEEG